MHAGGTQRSLSVNSSTATMNRKKLRASDSEAPPRSTLANSIFTDRVLFCSSLLFLVSLAHAIHHSVWDVTIGTAATALTSMLNHWFMSHNAFFKALDKTVPPPLLLVQQPRISFAA
jgi:hypothetical protein